MINNEVSKIKCASSYVMTCDGGNKAGKLRHRVLGGEKEQ